MEQYSRFSVSCATFRHIQASSDADALKRRRMNKIKKITLSLLVACGSNSICYNSANAQAEHSPLLAEGYGWQSQQSSTAGTTGSPSGASQLTGGSTSNSGQTNQLEGSMLYGQMNQVLNQNSTSSGTGSNSFPTAGTEGNVIGAGGFGSNTLGGSGDPSGAGLLNSAGSASNALGGSSMDTNGVGSSGSGSNGFGSAAWKRQGSVKVQGARPVLVQLSQETAALAPLVSQAAAAPQAVSNPVARCRTP